MKKYNLLLVVFILMIAFFLAFCNDESDSAADPLDATSWNLYAYRKSKPIPVTAITATFENGQIHGSAGCNSYSGKYSLTGQKINIEDLALTMMACTSPEGVMEQEQMIMQFFGDAQTFQLTDGQLMIFRTDGEALTFLPAG